MKKNLSIIAIVGSLIILFIGSSNCISEKASKQGLECFIDAGLTPIIIIAIALFVLRKK